MFDVLEKCFIIYSYNVLFDKIGGILNCLDSITLESKIKVS